MEGCELLLSAGGFGVKLVPREAWAKRPGLRAAADVNAVPPARRRRHRSDGQRRRPRRDQDVRGARHRRPEDEASQGVHREAVRAERSRARRGVDPRSGPLAVLNVSVINAARHRHRPRHGEHRPVRARRWPRLPRPLAAHRLEALTQPSALIGLLDDAHRGRAARSRRRAVRLRPAARSRARPHGTRHPAGAAHGRGRNIRRHRRPWLADANARALVVADRLHAGRRAPRLRAGAPESEPRRHGDRGQGVRGLRSPSTSKPGDSGAASARRRASCSSSAAPLRRRSPSSTEASWTASVERRGRLDFEAPGRSTARSHFSPGPSRKACSSPAASPRSPARRTLRRRRSPTRGRPAISSPARRISECR